MDPQLEQRRELLYSNLSKQLTRLNTNFEALNRNISTMRDQTETTQRLIVSQAAMFMGAKDVFIQPSAGNTPEHK